MKYFVFFALLNLFVCLAYSQKTCEKPEDCTPCQQVLYKYQIDANNTDGTIETLPPEDKCYVGQTYVYHFSQEMGIELAINKTCDLLNTTCNKGYFKFAYQDVSDECSKDILKTEEELNLL